VEDKNELSIEEVAGMLIELLKVHPFEPREQDIIRYHFGMDGNPRKKPREISRLVKLPLKKAELEIKRLETKVFNLLKSR
jgi:hypothetical protein